VDPFGRLAPHMQMRVIAPVGVNRRARNPEIASSEIASPEIAGPDMSR
jgi:hypothetical protein